MEVEAPPGAGQALLQAHQAMLMGLKGWSVPRGKCGSPEGGSLNSAAALAPHPAAPLAPPLVTLNSDSAGSGSPGEAPTSSQFQDMQQAPLLPLQLQQLQQQHVEPASKLPASAAAASPVRRSKRKVHGEAPQPAPRSHAVVQPAASVGDSQIGHACHGPLQPQPSPQHQHQVPHHNPSYADLLRGPSSTAAAVVHHHRHHHGPVLELPGLDDLDNVPDLDDLLMGMSDDDVLLNDPFASPLTALSSPWAGGGDPFAPQEQASPPSQNLVPSIAGLGPGIHEQQQVNPSKQQARGGGGAAMPMLVPQEAGAQLDRARSADTRRSHTSPDQLPTAPAPVRKLASSSGRKGAAGGGRGSKRDTVLAAAAAAQAALAAVPRATPAAVAAAAAAAAAPPLPLSDPRLVADPLCSGDLGTAAGLPTEQQQQLVPTRAPQPPSVQWLSQDASRLRPVKRAAPALSAPKQPALDAAKLNLSAAASLVAAAVAPAMPAACEMVGAADLRLLHCVFGSHFPVCWRL